MTNVLHDSIARARRYWRILKWDAAGTLTLQDSRASRIFHQKERQSRSRDIAFAVRGIGGGVIKSLNELRRSAVPPRRDATAPYLLLLNIGSAKYAYEEDEIVGACRKRGLDVIVVSSVSGEHGHADRSILTVNQLLIARDTVSVMGNWLIETGRTMPSILSNDRTVSSLWSLMIPAAREYGRYKAAARRIETLFGAPRMIFSLCPWTPLSTAFVDHFSTRGILSAGIRTQTTSHALEHLAINTDILFCKSSHERRVYQDLFSGTGPRLVDGLVLSLPAAGLSIPLNKPDRYALVLGSPQGSNQGVNDYKDRADRMFQVATRFQLPVIYKSHNLAKELDLKMFAGMRCNGESVEIISDVTRNRELIDGSSIIIAPISTLTYYAILKNKPIVLVDSSYEAVMPDEFNRSPIVRVKWDEIIDCVELEWDSLCANITEVNKWFALNYHLDKGADYILEVLSKEAHLNCHAA